MRQKALIFNGFQRFGGRMSWPSHLKQSAGHVVSPIVL